jgi:hypothetical protein
MFRSSWIVAAFAVLTFAAASPASAQLNWTVVGVGEIDTEDVALVLGSVSVSPAREGWSWVGGVTGSWMQYPISGDIMRSIVRVVPSIGVRKGFDGGSYQFRVGYAFRDGNDEPGDEFTGVPPVGVDVGDDGVVNSAQIDYWGTGSLDAQLIGSWNYGSESLWSRARVTQRLLSVGSNGHIRAGGEAAYLTGEGYNAWQIGPVVGFHTGGGTIINAGVGRKLASGDAPDATYFRAEIVLTPFR